MDHKIVSKPEFHKKQREALSKLTTECKNGMFPILFIGHTQQGDRIFAVFGRFFNFGPYLMLAKIRATFLTEKPFSLSQVAYLLSTE
jgi:hypothetical protein